MSAPPAKRQRTDGHQWCISASHAGELQAAGPQCLKMLISNNTAGVLIGKGGGALQELQSSTSCVVKLSPAGAFYPGTSGQRVAAVAGEQQAVEAAIQTIVGALAEAERQMSDREGRPLEDRVSLQVAIPNSACGLVIGNKGATQKQIRDQTGIAIKITPLAEATVPGERVATLLGPKKDVIDAAVEVCRCVQQDTTLGQHLQTPADTGGGAAATWMPTPPPRAEGGKGKGSSYAEGGKGKGSSVPWAPRDAASSNSFNGPDLTCTIYFEVSDMEAAHIIGKGGSFLQTIIKSTGAQVKLTKRGEISGTSQRQVSVTGPLSAVHSAHTSLVQRAIEVAGQDD